ncbi:MAG: cyclic nucleotide-binding domain-containing protein [Chloroflexota bacterium]|nr:MAG: cyclic nucleotide-binding domain-containing protein [Chloroflexota bacterium]
MNKIEVLKRSDLFRELDNKHLTLVAEMGAAQVFDAGIIIYKQGFTADLIYVIEEGLVGIILEVGPLAERQVQAAANFESFGWSAMIPPYTRTATVKAIEQTKVIVFDGRELTAFCTKHGEESFKIMQALARVIAERLRQAYIQLLGVTDGH